MEGARSTHGGKWKNAYGTLLRKVKGKKEILRLLNMAHVELRLLCVHRLLCAMIYFQMHFKRKVFEKSKNYVYKELTKMADTENSQLRLCYTSHCRAFACL